LPAAHFIFIALLKYGLKSSYLFDSAQPFSERLGIKESQGWNTGSEIMIIYTRGPVIISLGLFFCL